MFRFIAISLILSSLLFSPPEGGDNPSSEALPPATTGAAGAACDTCALPADPGPCEGLCPRFYYDVCSGQCQPFTYGCCEGNGNNFETMEQCQASCPPADDFCHLPADVGPCDGICPRYFFNACTRQCELFDYGCCGGNANNFETLADCQAACPSGQAFCGDCNADGRVDSADLALLLGSWGFCQECCSDLDGNGSVNAGDLALLLGSWG